MGTWGQGSFENDTASDWIYELKPVDQSAPTNSFAVPERAIDSLLNSDLYIDATECDEAVAAAECIAAALGNPMENVPEPIAEWIASIAPTTPSQDLVDRAKAALIKVRDDEQSESRELWSESTEDGQPDAQWIASINNLLNRLQTT
ncbi:MAG: DUF4259 domain-containing protein [Phycisphaerales bacterium]